MHAGGGDLAHASKKHGPKILSKKAEGEDGIMDQEDILAFWVELKRHLQPAKLEIVSVDRMAGVSSSNWGNSIRLKKAYGSCLW